MQKNAGDDLAPPKGESSLLSEAVVKSNATEQVTREKGCLEPRDERESEGSKHLEAETPTFVLLC